MDGNIESNPKTVLVVDDEIAIVELLKGKPSLNNVYLDERFKKQYVPQGLRSASKSKEQLIFSYL